MKLEKYHHKTLINNFCKLIAIVAIAAYSMSNLTEAGTLTEGNWSSIKCGKPIAPTLNLTDEDAYNDSVLAVNAYRQKIKPYLDCIVDEANADIQAINNQVKKEQLAIQEANNKISEDAKSAGEKFK
ncbi:hypothetical protein LG200_09070 [Methylobacillus caricis]|uniref:hypothetical protein n=1 Tax=Methylobacillus caricis TaxID=1971611 RepID=UPI001CFFF67B|nr:hypothetical protein [Methylobacillus caricis]MCB5188152.1 hypothetical protein [Methylobacillus caricis]